MSKVILTGFTAGAFAAAWFLGWRAGLEVLGAYVFCLVGARSPQTFSNSKAVLERVANALLAKATALAQRGK